MHICYIFYARDIFTRHFFVDWSDPLHRRSVSTAGGDRRISFSLQNRRLTCAWAATFLCRFWRHHVNEACCLRRTRACMHGISSDEAEWRRGGPRPLLPEGRIGIAIAAACMRSSEAPVRYSVQSQGCGRLALMYNCVTDCWLLAGEWWLCHASR